jgi:hypothetical protein
MDTREGALGDPRLLHRYLYLSADPINAVDPLGLAPSAQQFGYDVEATVQQAYVEDFGPDPRLNLGGWAKLGKPGGPAWNLKPDILDLRPARMIWMEIKPFSFSGIIRATGAEILYAVELSPFGVNPDVDWLKEGRGFQVDGQPVVVFNKLGILFYTTNRDDFDRLQEVMQAALGAGASVGLGATAGTLVNLIMKGLPQAAANGSEIQQINNLVQIGIKGSEAEAEEEPILDIAS